MPQKFFIPGTSRQTSTKITGLYGNAQTLNNCICVKEINKKSIDNNSYPNISSKTRQSILVNSLLGGRVVFGNSYYTSGQVITNEIPNQPTTYLGYTMGQSGGIIMPPRNKFL